MTTLAVTFDAARLARLELENPRKDRKGWALEICGAPQALKEFRERYGCEPTSDIELVRFWSTGRRVGDMVDRLHQDSSAAGSSPAAESPNQPGPGPSGVPEQETPIMPSEPLNGAATAEVPRETALTRISPPMPPPQAMTVVAPRTLEELGQQVKLVQSLMREHLKQGEHYGIIPGTQKNTLLKPGAEKLGLLFRLLPRYTIDKRDLPNGHREYEVTCDLYHESGVFAGQGVGNCSTMESKYRWRTAQRKCPTCGKATIFKSKRPGEGFYCWTKKGGCGATFAENAAAITSQPEGKRENEDIADTYNTVLKIGKKRALVDATIQACAASDIFTQDVGDPESEPADDAPPAPAAPAAPRETVGEPLATEAQVGLITRLLAELGWGTPKEYCKVTGEAFPVVKSRASAIIDGLNAEKRDRAGAR